MEENNNYGILFNANDLKIQREYFKEMAKLLGIKVLYRAPKKERAHYTTYSELKSNYYEPIIVDCIFDEHPTIWTTKKLGWNTEAQDNASIIYVPYDLEGLQNGALFVVPSGIDNSEGRLFRVNRMKLSSFIYPASIACEIVPEYENTFDSAQLNHEKNDFTLLLDESEKEEECLDED